MHEYVCNFSTSATEITLFVSEDPYFQVKIEKKKTFITSPLLMELLEMLIHNLTCKFRKKIPKKIMLMRIVLSILWLSKRFFMVGLKQDRQLSCKRILIMNNFIIIFKVLYVYQRRSKLFRVKSKLDKIFF